jgi:hypothetical protein
VHKQIDSFPLFQRKAKPKKELLACAELHETATTVWLQVPGTIPGGGYPVRRTYSGSRVVPGTRVLHTYVQYQVPGYSTSISYHTGIPVLLEGPVKHGFYLKTD